MTDQEQINALKAQVNCLREFLLKGHECLYEHWKGFHKQVLDLLDKTPEQCLAEVKAKAIEDALLYADHIGSNENGYDYAEEDLQAYADQLRDQAK